MDVADLETGVDVQEATATWDCTKRNCVEVATKRGPGGKPYCATHLAEIFAKKVATSESRHGTAGGGGHVRLLLDPDREALDIDALTRRIRVEAKAVERAARSKRAAERVPEAKREVTLSIQALARKLAAVTVSQPAIR